LRRCETGTGVYFSGIVSSPGNRCPPINQPDAPCARSPCRRRAAPVISAVRRHRLACTCSAQTDPCASS
jgi:hypothetical protein